MRKISKIFRDIRVADIADLNAKLINELHKSAVQDVHFTEMGKVMEQLNSKLVLAINKDKAESTLDEHDARRDQTYRSLLYLIKGYLHHPDASIREAAEYLDGVLSKYGFDLVNTNYAAESTLLGSLFNDVKVPELAPKIELLPGFQVLLEQLEADQANFKTAELNLYNDQAEIKNTDSATAVKRELLQLLNDKLVVYLRAMMQLQPELYTDLASRLAGLIDSANALVKRRRNAKEEVQTNLN